MLLSITSSFHWVWLQFCLIGVTSVISPNSTYPNLCFAFQVCTNKPYQLCSWLIFQRCCWLPNMGLVATKDQTSHRSSSAFNQIPIENGYNLNFHSRSMPRIALLPTDYNHRQLFSPLCMLRALPAQKLKPLIRFPTHFNYKTRQYTFVSSRYGTHRSQRFI